MTSYQPGMSQKRSSRASKLEIEVGSDTIPFAPAPLNPYGLLVNERPYIMAAFNELCARFDDNLAALDPAPAKAVAELAADEVTGGFYYRAEKNNYKEKVPEGDSETTALYERACMGRATPEELLSLLRRAPENLVALELAAQSRPFDWDTTEMDAAMEGVMEKQGFTRFTPEEQHPRHFFKRASSNGDARAVVMVREADRGFIAYDDTDGAALVQRDVFVLDLARPETEAMYEEMMTWLELSSRALYKGNRNVLYSRELLATFIEQQLRVRADERSSAIYPLSRSYFAYDIGQQVVADKAKVLKANRTREFVLQAAMASAE